MQRAVAFAARLGFTLDPPVVDAIASARAALALAAPARLMDEYYKILRTGASERIFAALRDVGLLEPLSAGAARRRGRRRSGRRSHGSTPTGSASRRRRRSLTNAMLLGSLIVPLGFSPGGVAGVDGARGQARPEPRRRCRWRAATSSGCTRC